MHEYEIVCLVCGERCTERGQVHATGWRLAPNRPGGYACGKLCDDVLVAYDKALKAARDKADAIRKAAKKKGPQKTA